MSPITYQVSVATLMHVADEYCTRSLGDAAVPPLDRTVVVPLVTALIVTCPAPMAMMLICDPIA